MFFFRGDREPVGFVSDWNGRMQEPLRFKIFVNSHITTVQMRAIGVKW